MYLLTGERARRNTRRMSEQNPSSEWNASGVEGRALAPLGFLESYSFSQTKHRSVLRKCFNSISNAVDGVPPTRNSGVTFILCKK